MTSLVGGLVLCGGSSRRMGTPKAWLRFNGETLLERTVQVLREVVEPVVVVAAANQELPSLPASITIVRDEAADRGPLQGLVTGLKSLGTRVIGAYVSGCDTPQLHAAFVRRIVDSFDGAKAVVPDVDGWLHPLAAVYASEMLPTLEAELAAGRLRMTDLFNKLPTRKLTAADLADVDPHGLALRNVNTPEEYQELLDRSASVI